MCPNRPVALDPALLFPMRHGSADVQQDLPVHQAARRGIVRALCCAVKLSGVTDSSNNVLPDTLVSANMLIDIAVNIECAL